MESLLGAMSGIAMLFGLGYLLLAIFIIVYFFRMSNDVRALKESLDDIKKILISKNSMNHKISTESDTDKIGAQANMSKSTKFQIGDLVISISSGKQMRIKTINEDGKCSCFTNGGTIHEGDFEESELKLFNS